MRTLAVVSGASRHERDRTPGRLAGFLGSLAELGAVDVVVIHDDAVGVERRRAWRAITLATTTAAVERPGSDGRVVEVAAAPLRASGMLREVHLHRSDAPEREARRTRWFREVDAFVASATWPHDVVWCADLAAATRAEWIRRALPAVVDVDRGEDLGSERARRSARRIACVAHLVTISSAVRRDLLALPGSRVVDPGDPAFAAALTEVVARAAAYRPVRTS